MHAAIDKEIARRKALPESEQPVDVLANMLKNIDYDGTRFNSLQIKDSVLTMMFAGYDTTSSTLACLIQYIYRHPDVHRRLQVRSSPVRCLGKLPPVPCVAIYDSHGEVAVGGRPTTITRW